MREHGGAERPVFRDCDENGTLVVSRNGHLETVVIRETLTQTRDATFAVLMPDPSMGGLPTPRGTGFFISPDGWFVTAAHVMLSGDGKPGAQVSGTTLSQEDRYRVSDPPADFGEALKTGAYGSALCQHVELVHASPSTDFALLKVDFAKNKEKAWLQRRDAFPYITVSARVLAEAEPVYSVGYPLSEASIVSADGTVSIGHVALCPRVTSTMVSARLVSTEMISDPLAPPASYVLDKALNYGNSGGPIVSVETGNVYAFCSRFQPVFIPQPHLAYSDRPVSIMVPSLYGIVTSFVREDILNELSMRNIAVVDK